MDSTAAFLDSIAKPPKERTGTDADVIALELSTLEAFASFASDLLPFAYSCEMHTAAPSDIIVRQGDDGGDWYVVYEGAVNVIVSPTGGGDDINDGEIVCSLGPGRPFGDVSILNNTKRNATIAAKEASKLISIPGELFLKIMKRIQSQPATNSAIEEEEEEEEGEKAPEAAKKKEEEKEEKSPPSSETVAATETKDADKADAEEEDAGEAFDPSTVMKAHQTSIMNALRAKPAERTVETIQEIFDEVNHIKAFSHLSMSVRRELCWVLTFECLPKKGDILFRQGDVGDSWYVIYRGSVNVLVNDVNVCTLKEGEGFGEIALVNDKPRSATIAANEDDCQLLKVDKHDYNRILKDIESNTKRLEEHGKVVVVLERRQINKDHQSFVIMLATPEKLVEYTEETKDADTSFTPDLLLTYRTFMSGPSMMQKFLERLTDKSGSDEILLQRRKRIVHIVSNWIQNYTSDFLGVDDMMDALTKTLDFLGEIKMDFEHDVLLTAIDQKGMREAIQRDFKDADHAAKQASRSNSITGIDSIRPREKKSRRYSTARSIFKIGRRYSQSKKSPMSSTEDLTPEPFQPPMLQRRSSSMVLSPQPNQDILRIYKPDGTYKALSAGPLTSAAELVQTALRKFATQSQANLASIAEDEEQDNVKYDLVEVKSDSSVRIFKPAETSIYSKLSINGRLYIRPSGSKDVLDAAPPIVLNEETTSILDFDVDKVAKLMCLQDHELFCRIEPVEYLYNVWGIHGKDVSNINMFVSRFNQVNYWVVTEICTTKALNRRSMLIKKFIKLASALREMNNFNSCFAVLSGLLNVAVSRMHGSWRKVPQKNIQEFEELQRLMDPTRNMRAYRSLLLATSPPLVPFFPIVMKDLFFTHECNDSTVDGLINFDKLRMIAENVRFMDALCKILYETPTPLSKAEGTLTEDEKMELAQLQKIVEMLNHMRVCDDFKTLSQYSRTYEPEDKSSFRRTSLFGS